MSRTTKLAMVTAAAAAAVGLTASPALAWTNGTFTANSSSLVVKLNGSTVATCTGSVVKGSITAAGVISVTSATATGCGATVTPSGFPWGGSITSTTASITGFKIGALGCTYSGTLSGTSTGSTSGSSITFTNQPVSGSGLLCFSGVTVSATYVVTQP